MGGSFKLRAATKNSREGVSDWPGPGQARAWSGPGQKPCFFTGESAPARNAGDQQPWLGALGPLFFPETVFFHGKKRPCEERPSHTPEFPARAWSGPGRPEAENGRREGSGRIFGTHPDQKSSLERLRWVPEAGEACSGVLGHADAEAWFRAKFPGKKSSGKNQIWPETGRRASV